MSGLESLEKLRGHVSSTVYTCQQERAINEIADEIEAEVERRYMRIPSIRKVSTAIESGVTDISAALANIAECNAVRRVTETEVTHGDVETIVGSIAAIADKYYVRLPVDRDGEPVRVGERVRLLHNGDVRTVTGLTMNPSGGWCVSCDSGGAFMLPESQRNVESAEPRTLEGLLEHFADEAVDVYPRDRDEWEPLLERYVGRIREMVGGTE